MRETAQFNQSFSNLRKERHDKHFNNFVFSIRTVNQRITGAQTSRPNGRKNLES